MTMEWRTPTHPGRSRVITDEILAALAQRPGEYAVVARRTLDKRKTVYVQAAQYNKRYDGFEFITRTEGDEVLMYARKSA